jgi:DNA adenine methylase
MLKRAKLKCCDFQEAIVEALANDLVYFDPPYITTHLDNGFIKYNSKLFHHSDELRLARTAQYLAMKTVSVIVSNAAHPLIRQQYDGPFFKTEVRRTSIIAADPSHRSKIKELVITTFPVNIR